MNPDGMEQIKKYRPTKDPHKGHMIASEEGCYVYIRDHERILAEKDAELDAEREETRLLYTAMTETCTIDQIQLITSYVVANRATAQGGTQC